MPRNSPLRTLAIALFRICTIASSATLRQQRQRATLQRLRDRQCIDVLPDHVFDRLVYHRTGMAKIFRRLFVGHRLCLPIRRDALSGCPLSRA